MMSYVLPNVTLAGCYANHHTNVASEKSVKECGCFVAVNNLLRISIITMTNTHTHTQTHTHTHTHTTLSGCTLVHTWFTGNGHGAGLHMHRNQRAN